MTRLSQNVEWRRSSYLANILVSTEDYSFIALKLIFTTRGYAKRGICRRRVSVTLWYCIKTAKCRITQIMPDSIFLTPKITVKFQRDHPLWGRQMQVE